MPCVTAWIGAFAGKASPFHPSTQRTCRFSAAEHLPYAAFTFRYAAMSVRIAYTSTDGEEREEEWPSVERFRNWAIGERLACAFTAYEADEDGEWVVIDKGRVSVTR